MTCIAVTPTKPTTAKADFSTSPRLVFGRCSGVEGAPSGLFEKLVHVLTNPGEWTFAAILVSLATAAIVIGHRIFY